MCLNFKKNENKNINKIKKILTKNKRIYGALGFCCDVCSDIARLRCERTRPSKTFFISVPKQLKFKIQPLTNLYRKQPLSVIDKYVWKGDIL